MLSSFEGGHKYTGVCLRISNFTLDLVVNVFRAGADDKPINVLAWSREPTVNEVLTRFACKE